MAYTHQDQEFKSNLPSSTLLASVGSSVFILFDLCTHKGNQSKNIETIINMLREITRPSPNRSRYPSNCAGKKEEETSANVALQRPEQEENRATDSSFSLENPFDNSAPVPVALPSFLAAPAPSAPPTGSGWGNMFALKPGEWACSTCTTKNPKEAAKCMSCDVPVGFRE